MTEQYNNCNITYQKPVDDTAWDQFLSQNNQACFYQLSGWLKVCHDHFGHPVFYLRAEQAGEIIGVFPLVLMKSKLFGTFLNSMPFINFAGPCAVNQHVEQMLLEQAIEIAKQHNVDHLEIRATKVIDKDLPTTDHKVSMTLELNDNHETLWSNFASKHRTNIRRAYKNGLHTKVGGEEYLNDFYHILAQSWKTLGTPIYKKAYFKDIFAKFGDAVKIFICYQNEKPIAAAFNGYYKDTVEGMWAGSIPEARKLQYSYVLYWDMIKHACENNYKHYHLGRSSVQSGGEQFKKKWNAHQTQLYWQYYLNKATDVPQLNVNNPKFQLAINTWRKLPLWATTTIGPWVAKYIP